MAPLGPVTTHLNLDLSIGWNSSLGLLKVSQNYRQMSKKIEGIVGKMIIAIAHWVSLGSLVTWCPPGLDTPDAWSPLTELYTRLGTSHSLHLSVSSSQSEARSWAV